MAERLRHRIVARAPRVVSARALRCGKRALQCGVPRRCCRSARLFGGCGTDICRLFILRLLVSSIMMMIIMGRCVQVPCARGCARVCVCGGMHCVCVTFCACVPRARAAARERACVLTRVSPCQAARGAAEGDKPTTAGTDGAGAGESISNSATVPPASRHAPRCASAHERARAKVTTRACVRPNTLARSRMRVHECAAFQGHADVCSPPHTILH